MTKELSLIALEGGGVEAQALAAAMAMSAIRRSVCISQARAA